MSDERLKEIKRMQNEIWDWSMKRRDRRDWKHPDNTDQIIFNFGILQSITKELIQELEEHI